MTEKKQFLIQNLLRHDSSSAASFDSTSAGVFPPSSSTSPPLHLPPPLHFFPFPTPIPTRVRPTFDLPRRQRGRPMGSKNKNKPSPAPSPSSNTIPPPPPSLRTFFLVVDDDCDILESLTRFCRARSVSLSVLSASGSLSYFVLRHSSSPNNNHAFHGRFDILSISTTVIIDSSDTKPNPQLSFLFPSVFTVVVSGPQGQVIGGTANGPLLAAGPVLIVAQSFDNYTYHRLPEMDAKDDDDDDAAKDNDKKDEGNERQDK